MKSSAVAISQISLLLFPGKAGPSPQIGSALGQHGLNIVGFCKDFNEKSKGLSSDLPVKVVISVYKNRSYSFIIKTPPASSLIKKALGIEKGSATPNSEKVGKIARAQLVDIVKAKNPDLTAADLEAGVATIAGTARSMGIVLADDEDDK